MIRAALRRLGEDRLLLALALACPILVLLSPMPAGTLVSTLPALIEPHTLGALAGLMILSRGLEDSGYLLRTGRHLLQRVGGERRLAATLVVFAAALSAVVTNDVALFIVVPLTLGLRTAAHLPIGRLIIFEALAVNAGSALSPVGNPQNLYLWQMSGHGFIDFTLAMLPLASALMILLLALIPFAFPRQSIQVSEALAMPAPQRALLRLSLLLYPLFLLAIELGYAVPGALLLASLYGWRFRQVLKGVDWALLVVFVLMFVDLGLLARLPAVMSAAEALDRLPGGLFTAAVALSQVMSNVPAAIFLQRFSDDWQALAWGVSVGGFGLAIGSLANLIALRLARTPGLWRDFHRWSMVMLVGGLGLALILGDIR